ncbi:MAG: hypothetical protein Q9210_001246 [Variospora velana]
MAKNFVDVKEAYAREFTTHEVKAQRSRNTVHGQMPQPMPQPSKGDWKSLSSQSMQQP